MNAQVKLHGDLLVGAYGASGFFLYDARDLTGGFAIVAGARAPVVSTISLTLPEGMVRTNALAEAPDALEARGGAIAIACGLCVDAPAAQGASIRRSTGMGFFGRRPGGVSGGAPSPASRHAQNDALAPATMDRRLAPDHDFVRKSRLQLERLAPAQTIALLQKGGRGFIEGVEAFMQGMRLPAHFKPGEWLAAAGLRELCAPLQGVDLEKAAAALRACPDAGLEAWMWYGAPPTREQAQRAGLDPDDRGHLERVAMDRAQAAATQPLLAGTIAADPLLSAAVDARRSLASEISGVFGLAPASIKRLGKVNDPGERIADADFNGVLRGEDALGIDRIRLRLSGATASIPDCLDLLKDLPPDWTPSTNPEWSAFTRIASAAAPLLKLYELSPMQALGTARGKWVDYEKTLHRAAGYDAALPSTRRSLALAFADAMECVHAFSVQTLLTPAVRDAYQAGVVTEPSTFYVNAAHRKALDMAFGASGVVGMLEMSRRWIGHMTRLSAYGLEFGDAPALEAPPTPQAFAPFTASNGLVVRHLIDDERIKKESSRLGHCVGRDDQSYRSGNMESRIHILSVTDAIDSQSFSTVEIEALLPDMPVKVRQHQGKVAEGREIPAKAVAAFNEFVAAVDASRIPVAREEIAAAKAQWQVYREKERDRLIVPEQIKKWVNYLGKRVTAHAGHDAFFVEAWSAIARKRPQDIASAAQEFGMILRPVTASESIASFGRQEMLR